MQVKILVISVSFAALSANASYFLCGGDSCKATPVMVSKHNASQSQTRLEGNTTPRSVSVSSRAPPPSLIRVEAGLSSDERDLFAAVKRDDFVEADNLLSRGTSPNCVDARDKNRTPIFYAETARTLSLLLFHGSSLSVLDSEGSRPQHGFEPMPRHELFLDPDFVFRHSGRWLVSE